jgi:flavorubredoxin
MYGMTQKAVESIENELNEMGINFVSLQLPQSTESDIVTQVFQSAAIVLAMPTYEYKMFPPMAHAIDELGRKRISNKHAFRFGSYGWSGGAEKELNQLVETYKMKWNFIDSVEFEGKALDEDIKKIKDGVKSLVQAMKDYIIE